MTVQVIVPPSIRQEMLNIAIWWSENRDSKQAEEWLQVLENLLDQLTLDPQRYTPSDESSDAPFPIYDVYFGIRRKTHRLIISLRSTQNEIVVHAVRHLSQDRFEVQDLQRE